MVISNLSKTPAVNESLLERIFIANIKCPSISENQQSGIDKQSGFDYYKNLSSAYDVYGGKIRVYLTQRWVSL